MMTCLPLSKGTFNSLKKQITSLQKSYDLVEIWFDEFNLSEEQITEVFRITKKPILYKVTTKKGLIYVVKHAPDFIDFDLSTPTKSIEAVRKASPKTKIIISHHDFKVTPSRSILNKILKKMESKFPDILKLATKTNTFSDTLLLLNLLDNLEQKGQKAIVIGMGRAGRLTRAAGHLLGNYIMYAPSGSTKTTAPGQIPIEELNKILKD